MTHEELLKVINDVINDDLHPVATQTAEALRAVVELHKPSKGSDELPPCIQCGQMYPCPTIQKIMDELK